MPSPRSTIRWSLTIAALLVLSAFSAAAQDSAQRKAFDAIYAKRNQALKEKDSRPINALLADDYTSKEADGKIKSRAQVVAETDAMMTAIEEVRLAETRVQSVKRGNNQSEAIVEFSDAVDATIKLGDGQLHRFEGKGKYRDTWVRTSAGWRLKLHEVLELTGLVDGKPSG